MVEPPGAGFGLLPLPMMVGWFGLELFVLFPESPLPLDRLGELEDEVVPLPPKFMLLEKPKLMLSEVKLSCRSFLLMSPLTFNARLSDRIAALVRFRSLPIFAVIESVALRVVMLSVQRRCMSLWEKLIPPLMFPLFPPEPTPTPKLNPKPLDEKSSSVCLEDTLRLFVIFRLRFLAIRLAPEILASFPVFRFRFPFCAPTWLLL